MPAKSPPVSKLINWTSISAFSAIKIQSNDKAANHREKKKLVLKKLRVMEEELHLFFNSFESISDNYTTLQHVKNILLEFNILDVAFRSNFAEIFI